MTLFQATGAIAYIKYGVETAFGTGVTCDKSFGYGVKISNWSKENNTTMRYGLGDVEAQYDVDGQFEGTISIDFDMSADPQWFAAVMGTVADTGVGPYIHTYTKGVTVPSLTIEIAFNNDTVSADTKWTLSGAIITDCKLSGEVGPNPIHASLTMQYKTELKASAAYGSVVVPADAPFSFGQATLAANGVTQTDLIIERFDLTIKHNHQMRYGLGSRLPQAKVAGQLEYSLDITNLYKQPNAFLENTYGASTGPQDTLSRNASLSALTITITNNDITPTTEERKWVFTFSNAKVKTHNLPVDVGDAIIEDVNVVARSLSVAVTNNTATG